MFLDKTFLKMHIELDERKEYLLSQVEALRGAKIQMLKTQQTSLKDTHTKICRKLQSMQPEPVEFSDLKIPDATPW